MEYWNHWNMTFRNMIALGFCLFFNEQASVAIFMARKCIVKLYQIIRMGVLVDIFLKINRAALVNVHENLPKISIIESAIDTMKIKMYIPIFYVILQYLL